MSRFTSPLDRVRVAAPCRADWDSMIGDERARFCHQCERNVYNLSGMSKREAEALISAAEGRLCVRFYRRADGSVLTDNCPVGLRALKRRVSRVLNATVSAALGFFTGLGITPTPRYTIMGGMAFDPAPSRVAGPAEPMVGVMAVAEPREETLVMGRMTPLQISETRKPKREGNRRAPRQR
jgi:hypothetical protein